MKRAIFVSNYGNYGDSAFNRPKVASTLETSRPIKCTVTVIRPTYDMPEALEHLVIALQ